MLAGTSPYYDWSASLLGGTHSFGFFVPFFFLGILRSGCFSDGVLVRGSFYKTRRTQHTVLEFCIHVTATIRTDFHHQSPQRTCGADLGFTGSEVILNSIDSYVVFKFFTTHIDRDALERVSL
jgi:hypothetical protein